MARRIEDLPDDPLLVPVEDEGPALTFDEWLALLTIDQPPEATPAPPRFCARSANMVNIEFSRPRRLGGCRTCAPNSDRPPATRETLTGAHYLGARALFRTSCLCPSS